MIGRNAPMIPRVKLIQAMPNQRSFTAFYRDPAELFLASKVLSLR